MILTLIAGWLLVAAIRRGCGRVFILLMIAIPPLLPFLLGLNPHRGGISWRSHIALGAVGFFPGNIADRFDHHVFWRISRG